MGRAAAAGRALRPHPVLRLALPVLRLRRLRRGGRARTEGADRRRSSRRSTSSSTCAPTRSTRRSAGRPPAARDGLSRGRDAVAPAGDGDRARCSTGSARGSASPTAPRSRSRRTRARTSAATRPRSAPPASRACRSARRPCRRPSCGGWAGGIVSSTSSDAVAEARAAGIGSVSLDLLYDVPDATLADWIETLDAALALEPDHLSLYALTLDDPDAEGLTGPGGDHLPTTAGARRWRDERPTAPGRGPGGRASTTTPSIAWRRPAGAATRSATGRGPATRAATTSAYWERRPYEAVGPGAHAFDGATRRWNAARLDGYLAALTPAGRGAPRLPPGGVRDARPGDRGGRGRDPRPPHGPRRAARGRPSSRPWPTRSAGRWPPSWST